MVVSLGVPIFRVFTVYLILEGLHTCEVKINAVLLYGHVGKIWRYRKNSKIWDTSNNCHNCPKNRKV